MNSTEFNAVLDKRIELICETLGKKAEEYSRNDDRLHNFQVAARYTGQTQEKALWGFLVKHLVSLGDMIQDLDKIPVAPTLKNNIAVEKWQEKLGDSINYLILLEAMIKDRYPDEIQF